MNEEKDKSEDNLTQARIRKKTLATLADAEAALAKVEKLRVYLEEWATKDERAHAAMLVEEAKRTRELCEAWLSKHPEQTL